MTTTNATSRSGLYVAVNFWSKFPIFRILPDIDRRVVGAGKYDRSCLDNAIRRHFAAATHRPSF